LIAGLAVSVTPQRCIFSAPLTGIIQLDEQHDSSEHKGNK
jgi:hypothetical protein